MPDSLQRPTLREGGVHLIRIDLRNDLDEDDEITAVSVSELSTSDLTISDAAPTSDEQTILKEPVPARKGVEFTVQGHLAATGLYRLKITFSTSGGVTNKSPAEDFVFDVVS